MGLVPSACPGPTQSGSSDNTDERVDSDTPASQLLNGQDRQCIPLLEVSCTPNPTMPTLLTWTSFRCRLGQSRSLSRLQFPHPYNEWLQGPFQWGHCVLSQV